MNKEIILTKNIDKNFKYEIAKEVGGEGILKCFACGSCTARCPEMDVNPEWNPRVIIRKALIGLKEEVLSSEFIWVCSSHYLCLERCPQKVDIKGIMNATRNTRLEEEHVEDVTGEKFEKAIDFNFKYKIVKNESGKDLYSCFSCGTCTAGCPEREIDNIYSPRKVIKNILLGNKKHIFENRFVEICSSHYRCITQCPQGVEIPKLMTAIRNIAEKYGYKRISRG